MAGSNIVSNWQVNDYNYMCNIWYLDAEYDIKGREEQVANLARRVSGLQTEIRKELRRTRSLGEDKKIRAPASRQIEKLKKKLMEQV